MPNVNPPVDAEHAGTSPDHVLVSPGADVVVHVGPARESATLPEPSAWRYILVYDSDRAYGGYVWAAG